MKSFRILLCLACLSFTLILTLSMTSCVGNGNEDGSGTHKDTSNPSQTDVTTEETTKNITETNEQTTEEITSETVDETTEETTGENTGTETDTTKYLDCDNAPTIEYANTISGGVNAYFGSPDRSKYVIENQNATLRYDLTTNGEKYVTSLEDPYGGVYLSNTMDVFIRHKNGKVSFASDNSATLHTNIFRFGYYYYDTHILGQSFGGSEINEDQEPYNINLSPFKTYSNDVSGLKTKGIISFTVASTNDPYIGSRSMSFSTLDYNALEIRIKCESATSAALYICAGSYNSFNQEQTVDFTVTPGDEYRTYIIPISHIPDYTKNVTGLRIDIGGSVGEQIEIEHIKAVKVNEEWPVKLDRTFHVYSDKMNEVLHFVATDTVDSIASYGMITEIDASTVESICVEDKNGVHTSLDGVDWDSAVYVGFDIKGVGIFGYILLNDESSGKLTVTLSEGKYSILQEYAVPEGKCYADGDAFYMGHRLYTSSDHNMEKFKTEAYFERNPLTDVKVTVSTDGSKYAGYDVFRGAYKFTVSGTDFSDAYYNRPNKHFIINTSFSSDTERKIYVYSFTHSGSLECAALLDSDGAMLPIDIEVCKNFSFEMEEPLFDPGDPAYGEAIFPIVVEPGKKNDFTIINLYQNWGNFPLKQLSSIQFISPYYHLSCGVTETNCIAPFYVYGKDYWTLPDFRAWSAPMWSSQPQHTSCGRLHFLRYTTAQGEKFGSENIKNVIDSSGPAYVDVTMDYISDDGNIKIIYRHAEMPHNDENRTYYTIDLTVLNDVSINDFMDNFSLFSFDGRSIYYNKLGYLDENGNMVITDANTTSDKNYIKLGKEHPYFDYFDAGNGDYVNFALIIKDSEITLGGEKFDGNFVLTDVKNSGLNYASLTLDIDDITLKAGDTMHIDLILMPWGYRASKDDSNVRNVRQDACIDPYKIEASVGEVIEDNYVPKVMCKDGVAEFTVSGGTNNMAIRVYGYATYRTLKVEEKVDGKWVEYKLHSYNGYDGYTVYYDGDGTFSYAFIIDMTGAEQRTFRVTVDPKAPIPEKDDPVAVIPEYNGVCNLVYNTKLCFDTVYKNTVGNMYEYQFNDGEAKKYLDEHPIILDSSWTSVILRGWSGAADGDIESYGYSINGGEIITNKAWRLNAEQDVVNAGGKARFCVEVPIDDYTKDAYIQIYAVLDSGEVVEMINFWLKGSED